METDLIIVSEYCRKSHIEPSFIVLLEEEGLLDIRLVEGVRYFPESQLRDLEKYSRLYYDLSINIEGIDAIRHLLGKIECMQNEMNRMRSRLGLYPVTDEVE